MLLLIFDVIVFMLKEGRQTISFAKGIIVILGRKMNDVGVSRQKRMDHIVLALYYTVEPRVYVAIFSARLEVSDAKSVNLGSRCLAESRDRQPSTSGGARSPHDLEGNLAATPTTSSLKMSEILS